MHECMRVGIFLILITRLSVVASYFIRVFICFLLYFVDISHVCARVFGMAIFA